MEENNLSKNESQHFFHGGREVSVMQKILIKMVKH